MIKTAVHMSMLCETWKDDISIYFESIAKSGFNGVEISLYGTKKENLRNVVKSAKSFGLECFFGTGISSETDISNKDKSIRKKGINYLKDCVEFGESCGARFLNGVIYAPWQEFSLEPRLERWKRSAESLNEVADYILSDFQLHPEVINRYETNFMNTLYEGSQFIELCNNNKIKMLADLYHMNIEENNIIKAAEDNLNNIGCFHVSENHRGVPGSGHLPFKELIKMLKKNNYDGYLDIESSVITGNEVGNAFFIWHNQAENALEEAVNGGNYLRKLIGELK